MKTVLFFNNSQAVVFKGGFLIQPYETRELPAHCVQSESIATEPATKEPDIDDAGKTETLVADDPNAAAEVALAAAVKGKKP